MPKNEDRPNCMRCRDTMCLDLFYKSTGSKDAGNELYVYSLLGKKIAEKEDLGAYVCANGTFLQVSCFLADSIPTDKQSYLSDILAQVARDFKASIFLAFSGHYRQAMQVLRCGFESIISGVYYYSDLLNLRKNNAKSDDIAKINQGLRSGKEEALKQISTTQLKF